jgi:hypothetical protein
VRVFYLCTTGHNALVASNAAPYRRVAATPRNLIFALNRPMQQAFAEAGIETRVWNHGVDLAHFHPAPRQPGPLTFGFIGQSAPFKRARLVLDAFLAAFGPHHRDIRLRMVAGPEMAQEHGDCADNVEFLAAVPHGELPPFYHSLDCLVNFSYGEGYNMTPIEALACGVPCMLTDSPEMHEPPYDRMCIHVPAARVLRPEVFLDHEFAPRDPAAYFSPPWVHEVSMDEAVAAMRAFAADPPPRRTTPLDPAFAWRGRIEAQVLPVLPDLLGPRGVDAAFRRLWDDPRLPRYRTRPLRRTAGWTCEDTGDGHLLQPPEGVIGLRCNDVGAAVWGLCDGRHRFVDIVYDLQRAVADAPPGIIGELDALVRALLTRGAIELGEE